MWYTYDVAERPKKLTEFTEKSLKHGSLDNISQATLCVKTANSLRRWDETETKMIIVEKMKKFQ